MYCSPTRLFLLHFALSSLAASPLRAQGGDNQRQTFQASFYTGVAIDAFAAAELRKYLNPEASGGTRERLIAGFDFEYRVVGDPGGGQQLWIYGETVHGIRSADVDCAADPAPAVCDPFDPATAGERTLYILREATSLEGFAGLRWEFAGVHKGDKDAARAYLRAQAGFLTVEENGSDVVDMHHIGLGLIVAQGWYRDSYLEVGFGTTHLFEDRFPRLKVDALLSWEVEGLKKAGITPFAQITIDSDLGDGADSIQSYIGIDFGLARLLGGKMGGEDS